MGGIDYAQAVGMLRGLSVRDMTCPECSHARKGAHQKLHCFRLRQAETDRQGRARIWFCCGNCHIRGVVTDGWGEEVERSPADRRQQMEDAARRAAQSEVERQRKGQTAARLWADARDPVGTLVEDYWSLRRLPMPIPPSVRFHPTGGQAHPSLVHAAGLPLPDGDGWGVAQVTGVHRTFIDMTHPKGRSHKQALGDIRGKPCVCHFNPESLSLVIGEGLEKVTKFARAWNVHGWSACGKSFLPALAEVVPDHLEVVTILRDQGVTTEVDDLATRLVAKGIEVRIKRQPVAMEGAQ